MAKQSKESKTNITNNNDSDNEILFKMHNASLEAFNNRRIYEWKFTTLVWTGIAGLIYAFMAFKVSLHFACWQYISLFIFVLLGISSYIFYHYRVSLAHQVDKRRAEMYEAIVNHNLNIKYEHGKVYGDVDGAINKYYQSIEKVANGWWGKGKWALGSQIIFLITFLGLAITIYFSIDNQTGNKEVTELKDKISSLEKRIDTIESTYAKSCTDNSMFLNNIENILLKMQNDTNQINNVIQKKINTKP